MSRARPAVNAKLLSALAIGAALLLLVVLWLLLGGEEETVPAGMVPTPEPSPAEDLEAPRVQLFFPGGDDVLHLEERQLPATTDPEEAATLIASAVLAGPETEHLRGPLPPDIEVGSLHFSADGTVYVDLVSETFASPPASGTRVELLSLYSLVNSIVYNVEGAKSVVILWNGRQPVTFGGHIDTSHPVRPEMGLVAEDARLLP